MGWWKMAIFHLKHSYLNWRAIPCRRRMVCVYAFFIIFLIYVWTQMNFSNAWYDNQFSFLFIHSFFLFFRGLSILGNDPCYRWSSNLEASLLMWGLFWKGWFLVQRLFMSFLSKERIMARKYSWKIGNFGQCAPRYQSKWFRSITILGLAFFIIEKVWLLARSCSESWCMPNYQLPVSFKNSLFFYCLIFEEFERKFLNQGFSHFLPRQAWSKSLFIFFKIVPLGVSSFFFQMVPKGVFIRMDSLLTMITNSFENPIIQKNLETFFYHNFLVTLWNLFPFLEISAKFIMTKVSKTQIHSFHANDDIKAVLTFLRKHIHEWKHS